MPCLDWVLYSRKKSKQGQSSRTEGHFCEKTLEMYRFVAFRLEISEKKIVHPRKFGAIALSYPPRVRVRAMVKLSAVFFHESHQ